MTTTATTSPEASATRITELGRQLLKQIGDGTMSFFDDGVVTGSGSWGEEISNDARGFKSKRSISGILNGLEKAGMMESQEHDKDKFWWTLTAVGAEVARYLADDSDDAPTDVQGPQTADDAEAEATRQALRNSAAEMRAADQAEQVAKDIVEQGDNEREITLDEVADAVERAQTPLTRKQCVDALKAAGYTGPTSYLMPRLRDIVAEVLKGGQA